LLSCWEMSCLLLSSVELQGEEAETLEVFEVVLSDSLGDVLVGSMQPKEAHDALALRDVPDELFAAAACLHLREDIIGLDVLLLGQELDLFDVLVLSHHHPDVSDGLGLANKRGLVVLRIAVLGLEEGGTDAALENELEQRKTATIFLPSDSFENQISWLHLVGHAQLDEVVLGRPEEAELQEGFELARRLGILVGVVEVAEELRLLESAVDLAYLLDEGRAESFSLFGDGVLAGLDNGRAAEVVHLRFEIGDQVVEQLNMLALLVLDFLLTILVVLDLFLNGLTERVFWRAQKCGKQVAVLLIKERHANKSVVVCFVRGRISLESG